MSTIKNIQHNNRQFHQFTSIFSTIYKYKVDHNHTSYRYFMTHAQGLNITQRVRNSEAPHPNHLAFTRIAHKENKI